MDQTDDRSENEVYAHCNSAKEHTHRSATYTMIHTLLIPKVSASTKQGGMGSEVLLSSEGSPYDSLPDETGWDRLKSLWETDMYGEISPELQLMKKQVFLGALCGGAIGAFIHTRTFTEDFVRQNKDKIFLNTTDAKRNFQDNYILAMMRGFFQWGWRVGLFCGLYSSIALSMAVYNDKISVSDHVLAGATCGALWKHRQGLRAIGVSGAFGGALGAVAGGCIVASLWFTGVDFKSLRYWHHTNRERRLRNAAKRRNEKKKDKPEDQLLSMHEERLKHQQDDSQK